MKSKISRRKIIHRKKRLCIADGLNEYESGLGLGFRIKMRVQ